VVERVSGMPLDAFFAERILGPLGMHDTFFQVPADKIDRLSDCYTLDRARAARDVRSRRESLVALSQRISGGGGLVSTALDYHRFCSFCLNGGELDGVRLVSPKTIELMTMNHLPGGGDLATMSKLAVQRDHQRRRRLRARFRRHHRCSAPTLIPGSAGEYYWGGMFSTAFFVDPVERIHMVFMTQLTPSMRYPIRRELKTLIYSALNTGSRL
jgi:CubicO group peptidase (beta-lactamase class C family)